MYATATEGSPDRRPCVWLGLAVCALWGIVGASPAALAQTDRSGLDSAIANEAILEAARRQTKTPLLVSVVSAATSDGTKWVRALVADDRWPVQRPYAARAVFTCTTPDAGVGDPDCWDVTAIAADASP